MCGAVIDIGNAYRVHQQLQASADAAAAAGASNLPSAAAAITAATKFSAGSGGKNPIAGAGPVAVSATADCSTSPEFCNPANTVHVTAGRRRADHVSAGDRDRHDPETVHAQACSPCGGLPLDVMIVLDRPGSMSGAKLDVGQGRHPGVHGLDGSDPDNVGLAVLPPAANAGSACARVGIRQLQPRRAPPTYWCRCRTTTTPVTPGNLNPAARADLHPQLRPGRWPDRLRQRARCRPGRARRGRTRRHPDR